MRFGDTYIKQNDGTLDVIRDGAKSRIATGRECGPTYTATKSREAERFSGLVQAVSNGVHQ
jgi:hypothetical protein